MARKRVHPKVKAAAVGGAGGGVAAAVLEILAYYLTPLVPSDIWQPVWFLVTLLVTGGLSAAGAYIGGYLKSG